MTYPIPQPESYYYFQKNITHNIKPKKKTRKKLTKTTQEYLEYAFEHGAGFASIPFVTHVYLCNSITFNAAKQGSDIDVVIVTHPRRLWVAKLYTTIWMWYSGLKRQGKEKNKRFCLSFFIAHDGLNLYPIKREHVDTYLYYRIAHLIPLYIQSGYNPNAMLRYNEWITTGLPNIPTDQLTIRTGKTHHTHTTYIKKILEKIHKGIIGDTIELVIKHIWLPIIYYKQKKQPKKHRNIIITNTMLKFYYDKRDIIQGILKIKST